MKKLYSSFLFIFVCSGVFSQAIFYNNGADIYVKNGGFVIVKNDSLQNKAMAGIPPGLISNEGTIIVEGPIINYDSIIGNGDTIKLLGDWVNNNLYAGNNSWVYLNGGPQVQNITGTAVTTFNNLDLSAGAEKRQQINAITTGLLNLNNAELATDVNQMLVTNTNPLAITRANGFASSTGAGNLAQVTNSTSSYVLPVGSPSYINGPSIFRPVAFTPNTAATDTFGACLIKGNASADGYNIETLDNTLCLVNPNFYHRLYNGTGAAAADLSMYFNASTDGDWTDEAHWKNNEWNYIAPATASSALGLSTVTVPGVSDFNPNPFALARKKFQLVAGPDVSIPEGQSTTFAPTIGAATGAAIDWTPDLALTCNTCADPVANPTATTRYTITVTDAGGCKISDSLLVNVTSSGLLIPTGFTPNEDGVNDVFHVLNKNLAKVDLAVFNRWGVKVFETTDWTVGWDGTYKGVKQEIGVYIWECAYQFTGETISKSEKGNVTLLR